MDNRYVRRVREELSPREKDVLAEMALGLSNAEIARKLFISPHTVKNHITAIYRKMGADDRTRVVVMAIRMGLVSLEPLEPKVVREPRGRRSEGASPR